jgi:CBS domain-containing protein
MKKFNNTLTPPRLVLHAGTAEELMTPNPVSLNWSVTVHEAAIFLVNREISAAPVIDEAGHPVGVLSRADIVRYEREKVDRATPIFDFDEQGGVPLPGGETMKGGFQIEVTDRTLVREIMTPAVISVSPSASVVDVVAKLVAMKLHRLFVVDEVGVLVGVISTLDVLRKLRTDEFN